MTWPSSRSASWPSGSPPTGSTACSEPTPSRRSGASSVGVGLAVDGSVGPETLRAFADLARAVSGGSPHTLREQELVRRSGHRLIGRIVVLDPGHGGDDTGTAAHGLTESEVMLDLARRIEGRLSAIGVTVLFTRSATTGPDDLSRAMMANEAGADIMLSLHCDSTDQSQGQRGRHLLLRTGSLRGLVSGGRAARGPDPARDRGPHRPDRLPFTPARVGPAPAHPDAHREDRGRLPQPRRRTQHDWPTRRSGTPWPRRSSSLFNGCTSVRTTPTPPASCAWVTCEL